VSPAQPRIVLAGATGRTGNAVAHGLAARDDVQLVACVAPSLSSAPTRPVPAGTQAVASLAEVTVEAEVLVDLTHADAACDTLPAALERGWHVVLGTTGIAAEELERLGTQAAGLQRGLLYAPNFAIGAVLMMQFAQQAARWLPDAEIIEMHHEAKRDAPSGTARRTAELVRVARGPRSEGPLQPGPAARGDLVDDIPVHSLRLPGAVAHQEVIFGAAGERLTIRHDALDRACYAAGVAAAVHGVTTYVGLRTGLESVL